jgi:hypothetical protein
MGRQTENYFEPRAAYSEATYLKSVLLWLGGHSGPLGGVPKAMRSDASHESIAEATVWGEVVDVPSFLPARSSYE